MEKEKNDNFRFYILLIILGILSLVISYFNYKLEYTIFIPKIDNSTYKNIQKHVQLLKNIEKYT
tara:strand:+ start:1995 stop:2186 length:192 start_codon:yes stop_codon:yes gene_type:complete